MQKGTEMLLSRHQEKTEKQLTEYAIKLVNDITELKK